ncbi:MAG: glycosyltransferase family 2 protein [Puia sp.]|nr:glycosyltransferase family 2 protein [Puia sp.]
MIKFKNPDWIKPYEYPYEKFEQIPESVFAEINHNLDQRISKEPLVSILIAAWNEEINILRSVASLARLETKIPYEIIVVNNNSKDNTQLTIDKLHVRSFFAAKQGPGPARQVGQENALGKYILLADADCIYPVKWLEKMANALQKPGVVVVYGRYAFLSEPGYARWQLSILETFKNIIAELRHIKRPFMNTYGMSMGYIKEYGLKAGFLNNNIRGEDGRMTYDLMPYGKVVQVRSRSTTVWTGPRTLKQDGTLTNALKKRIVKEIRRFGEFFHTRMKYHAPKD